MAVDLTWILFALASVIHTTTSHPTRETTARNGPYTGFKVLEVQGKGSNQAPELIPQLEANFQVDVWGHPSRKATDIMVSPVHLNDVLQTLTNSNASYVIKFDDVQKLLEDHVNENNKHSRYRRAVFPQSFTRRYLRLPQIRHFLSQVRDNATVANVTVSSMGRSFEGRSTPYVTLRNKNSRGDKMVVLIDAGIHSREWIAPAMALNIIYKLAFNPNNDPVVEELLEKFDWIIVPVLNPDGYVYSHMNASTRLWRKTRSSAYSNYPDCHGVDANRNFGYQWSDSPQRGGSSNPCNDNYSGPEGFSEPETRNMRNLMRSLQGRIAAYLSLHSYGQYFLFPWGYDAGARLDDEQEMMEVARKFSDAMWQKKRWYEIGAAAKVLYAAAGASDDYARGGAGVKYAFTVELSPSDSSSFGFLLPASLISSVVDDHWPAFKAVALTVWDRLVASGDAHDQNSDEAVESDSEEHMHSDESDTGVGSQQEPATEAGRRKGDNPAGRGQNVDGRTIVSINGHKFQINLNDPETEVWLRHYIEYLHHYPR